MSRNVVFPPSASHFLLASKRGEITELQQLLQMGQLVGGVSQLIHLLQRERGTANLFLCSNGALFGERLAARARDVQQAELVVQRQLAPLGTASAPLANASRLFSRIACALHHLTQLPTLRRQTQQQQISPSQAMNSFNDIIRSLLALVFETADACVDPLIARRLIAMFSFMQGKELAGQERAIGAVGFATQCFSDDAHQQLLQLIEGQERCFQCFTEFADPLSLAQWQRLQQRDDREFERLRRIACTQQQPTDGNDTSLFWFDITTARIDLMKHIEDRLAAAVMEACRDSLAAANTALAQTDVAWPRSDEGALTPGYAVFVATPQGTSTPLPGDGINPRLGRAMIDMLQQQSQRLQALSAELAATRATLEERRDIERAKNLLIQHRGMSEPLAHQLLRKMAMDQNKRLVDIARAMLSVADILPGK